MEIDISKYSTRYKLLPKDSLPADIVVTGMHVHVEYHFIWKIIDKLKTIHKSKWRIGTLHININDDIKESFPLMALKNHKYFIADMSILHLWKKDKIYMYTATKRKRWKAIDTEIYGYVQGQINEQNN